MECATIDDMKSKPFNFNKVIQRKQRHIISCWHHVGRESLAMWDTSYKTPEARRVYAIKFDTTLLIDHVTSSYFEESVEQIIKTKLHGKVIYKNLLRSQELLEGERIRNAAFILQNFGSAPE